jgi:hypothetical protein
VTTPPVTRYTPVRHRHADIAGATHGVVLASFEDLTGRFYAVVLWDGESMTITETYLLEATHR